ncbi:phospholipase effector Tle1 domain-containing protein [Stenotrophomonas forensis]|uniref:phospholipase effector Tle1 domain-containing protein n=1 Tax=Stenotrophomonas forensis TaxID=2871169 RepID=UPI0036D55930
MAPLRDTDEDVGLLRIGLFFDGTRNNAHNLARGRPQQPHPRPVQLRADDDSTYQSRLTSSYDNGETNIARLQQLYPDSRREIVATPSLSIYVEGVGTRDGADDDLIGLAFGIGASGVRAKVQRALQVLLPAALAGLATGWRQPLRRVQLDLFGFSRGAAAARDIANQLQGWDGSRWRQLLQEAGLACAADFAPAMPVVRFIGLFDTVVAVSGGRADEQPRLALHSGIAAHVVQLTARDEHRQHYPLTSVAPPFTEIALPGVHANIGGGYNQLEEGPKLLSRPRRQQLRRPAVADYQIPPLAMLQATTAYAEAQADAERWRQQLGVGDKEIWVDVWHQWQQQRRAGSRSVLLSPVLYVTAAVVLRRRIDWRYQLIALQVMQQHAIDAGVQWRAHAAGVQGWELPPALQPIARRLVAGQALTQTQEALLRRRYLMQSAHWNFDALGDTALTYAADAGVSELPYRPGPGLFYINRPTVDGKRMVLPNA